MSWAHMRTFSVLEHTTYKSIESKHPEFYYYWILDARVTNIFNQLYSPKLKLMGLPSIANVLLWKLYAATE